MAGEYIDEVLVSGTTFKVHDTENRETVAGLSSNYGPRITALETAVTGIPSTYSVIGHTHTGAAVYVALGEESVTLQSFATAATASINAVTASLGTAIEDIAELSTYTQGLGNTISGLSSVYAPILHGHNATTISYTSGGSTTDVATALDGRALSTHTHTKDDLYYAVNQPLSNYLPTVPMDSTVPGNTVLFLNKQGSWTNVAVNKTAADGAIGADQAINAGKMYSVALTDAGTYAGYWAINSGATVTKAAVTAALGATASTVTSLFDDTGNWTTEAALKSRFVNSTSILAALGTSALPSSSLYLNEQGSWSAPYMEKLAIDGKLAEWDSGLTNVSLGYVYSMGTTTIDSTDYKGGRWKSVKALLGATSSAATPTTYLNQAGNWTVPPGSTMTKTQIEVSIGAASNTTNVGRLYTAGSTGGSWSQVASVVSHTAVDTALGAYSSTANYVYAIESAAAGGHFISVKTLLGCDTTSGSTSLFLNQQGSWTTPSLSGTIAAERVSWSGAIGETTVTNVSAALTALALQITSATAITEEIMNPS